MGAVGDRKVCVRPEGTLNKNLSTGEIEVEAVSMSVQNRAKTPPFEICDDLTTNEDVRLEFRYLDLRRSPMQKILMTRSTANQAARSFMTANGFVEVETPFMVKYTPGGARNFLVPSRLNKGTVLRASREPAALQATADGQRLWTAISKSCAASVTKIYASTGSPSSRRSTSRCPSSNRTTSSRWSKACSRPFGRNAWALN